MASANGSSLAVDLPKGSDGEVALSVPRDREGSFEPELVKKGQTRIDGVDDKIIGLYALSIKHRKRIEEAFGWAKTVGGMAQTVYRGVERVRSRFILTMAANNLARLPRLLGA